MAPYNYDRLSVQVISAGGGASSVATFSNQDRGTAGAYVQRTCNLAAWKGQTVTLRFLATTNKTRPTSFLVDDVSLR